MLMLPLFLLLWAVGYVCADMCCDLTVLAVLLLSNSGVSHGTALVVPSHHLDAVCLLLMYVGGSCWVCVQSNGTWHLFGSGAWVLGL
jgi:hypothetical protein